MKDIPASYLLWLWENGLHARAGDEVHGYIKSNLYSLEQDAPDFIVKHRPVK